MKRISKLKFGMCNPPYLLLMSSVLMMSLTINPGDPIILFGGPNKIYLSQVPPYDDAILNKQSEANLGNQRFIHNRNGIFDLVYCIGKSYGQKLFWDSNNKNHWVVPLRPTPELITKTILHRTQILYRADISIIILLLDLIPGKLVLECGTGSGSLSYSLATAVSPTGHVFTFDYHIERKHHSTDLFEKTNISKFLTVCERDAYTRGAFLLQSPPGHFSVTENSIDSVFLDLPSPWKAIENVVQVIKHFGKLVVFTPSMEQTQKLTECLQQQPFTRIRTFEILTKPWGISFDGDFDSSSGEDEDETTFDHSPTYFPHSDNFVNYQLPQFNHTGYITVATANLL